ncbi:pilin [Candidatus Parcubacteria bacterium]|nr:pilin [Candidatus Parcubacteria bacterium]
MNKIVFYLALLSLGLSFYQVTSATTCTLQSVAWDRPRAGDKDSVKYTVTGSNCAGFQVAINIWEKDLTSDDFIVQNTLTFPANGDSVSAGWYVDASQGGDLTGDNQFFIVAQAGTGTGSQVKSDYLYVAANGSSNGGASINFDVNPKKIPASSTEAMQYTLKVNITNPSSLTTFCGATQGGTTGYFYWNVFQGSKLIRGGNKPIVATQYNLDFTENINLTEGSYPFYAELKCLNNTNIQRSATVNLVVGSGSTGGPGSPGGGGPGAPGGTNQDFSFQIPNPLSGRADTLLDLVNVITTWIFNISIPIAVIFILWAGFLMLTAGATPANFAKGRKILLNVVIGLAIVFIGRGFITLIQSVLELGSPQTTTGTGTSSTKKGPGGVCAKETDCKTGLWCNNTMCQYTDGNTISEPCLTTINCGAGLVCVPSNETIDGRPIGRCRMPN